MIVHKIKEAIKERGPIPFKDFMDMALYLPEYGYYTSGDTEIGKEGDFFTSSHLHPVFGELIGLQIEQMWELAGNPGEFYIIEFGAGKGYVFYDLISSQKNEKFLKALKYVIIEKNLHMRKKQAELILNVFDKVQWRSSLHELGEFCGCVFSNELLDAFPVHLIETVGNKIMEVHVDFKDNAFIETLKTGPDMHYSYFKDYSIELPGGYKTEINYCIKDWFHDISKYMIAGFVFTIDYGYPAWDYYSPERPRGTLLCYHKHKVIDNPYENVGKQDMTAHVNFSSISHWGRGFGFVPVGYCTQGNFLMSMGIDEALTHILETGNDYENHVLKIKRLLLPQGMGTTHKVMILQKSQGEKTKLKGFNFKNSLNRL